MMFEMIVNHVDTMYGIVIVWSRANREFILHYVVCNIPLFHMNIAFGSLLCFCYILASGASKSIFETREFRSTPAGPTPMKRSSHTALLWETVMNLVFISTLSLATSSIHFQHSPGNSRLLVYKRRPPS